MYIYKYTYIYYNFLIGTTYFLAHFSSELLSPPKTLRDVGSYESLHFPAQDLGHPQLSQAIPVIKAQRLPGDTKQPKNDTLIGKTKWNDSWFPYNFLDEYNLDYSFFAVFFGGWQSFWKKWIISFLGDFFGGWHIQERETYIVGNNKKKQIQNEMKIENTQPEAFWNQDRVAHGHEKETRIPIYTW